MFNWNPFSKHRVLFDMYHSYSKSIFILTSPSKTPKMRPPHRLPPFIPCGMGKWCRNCHVCLMAGWDSDYFMRFIQELTTVLRYVMSFWTRHGMAYKNHSVTLPNNNYCTTQYPQNLWSSSICNRSIVLTPLTKSAAPEIIAFGVDCMKIE